MGEASEIEARQGELELELQRMSEVVERLERSNQTYELAHRLAGANMWEWTLASDEVRRDPGLLELFGYTTEDFPGNLEAVRERLESPSFARAEVGRFEVD